MAHEEYGAGQRREERDGYDAARRGEPYDNDPAGEPYDESRRAEYVDAQAADPYAAPQQYAEAQPEAAYGDAQDYDALQTPYAAATESYGSATEPYAVAADRDDDMAGLDPSGDLQAHPGWTRQPQTSYEAADSGGWGGPQVAETGPLHLNAQAYQADPGDEAPAADAEESTDRPFAAGPDPATHTSLYHSPSAGDEAVDEGAVEVEPPRFGTRQQASAPLDPGPQDPGPQSPRPQRSSGASAWSPPPPPGPMPAAPAASGPGAFPGSGAFHGPGGYPAPGGFQGPGGFPGPGTAGPPRSVPGPSGAPGGPPWQQQPPTKTGLAAVFDFSFAARATRVLARPLFWLVVALVVIDVVTVLVSMLTAGPYSYSGGTIFFAFLQALLTGAVKIALARLFLELCVNISDLAQQRTGQR